MKALVDYLKLKNPKKIGINISDTYGIADGLSVTDYELLMNYLPSSLKSRVVSSEPLAVSWIETRTEKEMTLFSHLTEITHNIIKEAFSTGVITPGVTTTDDVVWWMREKVSSMGLKTWFHPTIDVQRASLEIRDLKESKIDFLFREIEKKAKIIASNNDSTISFSSIDINASPALMNKQIQSLIIDAANELNYSFKKMPSGAGHDAQDMAVIVPSGMIFIPSVDGISHSPKEFSSEEAVYKGTNILLQTILKIDKERF